jgi:hypothetical protein
MLSFQILVECDAFNFESIVPSFFVFGYHILWFRIYLVKINSSFNWQYPSCHVTLVPSLNFFKFLNGEYNKGCSIDQFSISLL